MMKTNMRHDLFPGFQSWGKILVCSFCFFFLFFDMLPAESGHNGNEPGSILPKPEKNPVPVDPEIDHILKSLDSLKPETITRGRSEDGFRESREERLYDIEVRIGDLLAMEGFRRFGLPIADGSVQKYVNLVGNAVAINADRSDNPYYFVVVDNDSVSAFSCPGGVVVITNAFFRILEDEAELAGVLAHEIAHVDRRDLLNAFLESDTSRVRDIRETLDRFSHILFEEGMPRPMVLSADRSGMEMVYRAGYDPSGILRVLHRLNVRFRDGKKMEIPHYSLPLLHDRIGICEDQLVRYPDHREMAQVKERFQKYRERRLRTVPEKSQ